MKIIEISGYACGYHSEQEWSENVYIKKETYEKHKEQIDKMELYIGELDGKHSETEADIEITELNDGDIVKAENGNCYDCLQDDVRNIVGDSFMQEYKEVWAYIESFDRLVEVTVSVHQSNVKELEDFARNL